MLEKSGALQHTDVVPRSATRGRIVDSAIQLIAGGSIESCRLKDIADELGFKTPAIYAHFPAGRDGVLDAVASRVMHGLAQQFPYDGNDPSAALEGGIRQLIQLYADNPAFFRIQLRDFETPGGGLQAMQHATGGSHEKNLTEGPMAPLWDRIARILEDGYREGLFRKVGVIATIQTIFGVAFVSLAWPRQAAFAAERSNKSIESIQELVIDVARRWLAP